MKRLFSEKTDILWVLIAAFCTAALAYHSYKMKPIWPGIPPTPSESASLFYGYGDYELSYRNIGLMLQNAGDTGGRTTNLKEYNYQTIEDWLWLSNKLDNKSGYVPTLAAYYFGAVQDPAKLEHLVDYLAYVGLDNQNERWRWLAHAIFLARFKLEDQPRALEMAKKLSAISDGNMPGWTKVMPAYVMNTMGNKKEARDLFLLILADPTSFSDRADVNQSCWFINKNLREPDDGLDDNDIYKTMCEAYLQSEKEADALDAVKQADKDVEAVPEDISETISDN